MEQLKVVASFDWLDQEENVGVVSYENVTGKDVYAFEYDKQWIRNHPNIVLDGALNIVSGVQYINQNNHIFGCFSDCLPDHWGKIIVEFNKHHDYDAYKYSSSEWEYLKATDDFLRSGGFRFKDTKTDEYITINSESCVQNIFEIDKLYEYANNVEEKELEREIPDRNIVKRLYSFTSSVGGARPKANVIDKDGIYIAKFPSSTDGWNVGRWEYFANKVAEECGIKTAKTKVIEIKKGNDIFLSKRFDRTDDGKRIHMASALNLLGVPIDNISDPIYGYYSLSESILQLGLSKKVNLMLEEIYRRAALSICIGNCDDHLKNHSFLLRKNGWELSPVYDINPTFGHTHTLLFGGKSNIGNLDDLFKSHKMYMLDEEQAYGIIKEVTQCMKYWKNIASECKIKDSEMDKFEKDFEVNLKWGIGGRAR